MEQDDPTISKEIKALGRQIRLIFIEEKSRALKKPYKPSARHDIMPHFYRAATQVKRLEADPQDYIMACIQNCKIKGGPFANQLGGPAGEGWYRQYLEGKGISTARLGKKEKTATPETPVYDVFYACDADLQMDIEITLTMLRLNTGDEDPLSAENIKLLRDPYIQLPLSGRALLGYHDEEVLRVFGKEILEYFTNQPNYQAAAVRAGYPIDVFLPWLRNHHRA